MQLLYTAGVQKEHARRLRQLHERHAQARRLTSRLADEKSKYAAWLHAEHGASFADIAAALGLSSRTSAQKLVERGNAL